MGVKRGGFRAGLGALASLLVLGVGGCTEYGIVTTLDPDGGGSRLETVRVTPEEQADHMPPDQYVYLLGLGSERGWTHRVEVDEDTTHVFERSHRIAGPADWDRLGGSVVLHGTTPAHADETVGRVRLGAVEFSNRVSVVRSHATRGGGDTLVYRESFSWRYGADAFVEALATGIPAAIAEWYPGLSAERRGELAGLVRAGLWSAIDAGMLDPASGADDDVLFERFVSRTADHAAAALRGDHPDIRAEELEARIRDAIEDGDEGLIARLLETKLPGLDIAGTVSFELRLVPPGRVLESNAESTAGDTLVWTLDAWDALATPVEAFAISVLDGT